MKNKVTSLSELDDFLESKTAHKIILGIILLNAAAVALQTSAYMEENFALTLYCIEWMTIILFVVEIAVRAWAQRARFLKQGWNIFDVLVVGVSLLPHEAGFSILRSFRILKSLSVFETTPHTQHVVSTVMRIWPRVFVALILMGLSFFILGVIGVELYAVDFPVLFGDLGKAIFTLSALMQSDGYADTVGAVMDVYPLAWIYFLVVVVLLAFVMLNLFVGIIVDAMQGAVEAETASAMEETEKLEELEEQTVTELKVELNEIKKSLASIKASLKK